MAALTSFKTLATARSVVVAGLNIAAFWWQRQLEGQTTRGVRVWGRGASVRDRAWVVLQRDGMQRTPQKQAGNTDTVLTLPPWVRSETSSDGDNSVPGSSGGKQWRTN